MFYIFLLSILVAGFVGLFGLWLFIWSFTMSYTPEQTAN